MADDSARLQALVRLALSEPTSAATLEAKERALGKLADDLLAGCERPLDRNTLHSELEVVVSSPLTSSRALSAVLRAAGTLEQLDAQDEAHEPIRPPEADKDDDPFTALDRITDMGDGA